MEKHLAQKCPLVLPIAVFAEHTALWGGSASHVHNSQLLQNLLWEVKVNVYKKTKRARSASVVIFWFLCKDASIVKVTHFPPLMDTVRYL